MSGVSVAATLFGFYHRQGALLAASRHLCAAAAASSCCQPSCFPVGGLRYEFGLCLCGVQPLSLACGIFVVCSLWGGWKSAHELVLGNTQSLGYGCSSLNSSFFWCKLNQPCSCKASPRTATTRLRICPRERNENLPRLQLLTSFARLDPLQHLFLVVYAQACC